ncbi:hypothetical protein IFT48_00100 [Pseudomonas fluorescens]|uniref:hypothetical protein n=1 Tax=Pseudomonas TaxID=286 RepID=UPI000F0291D6|nr:MULTISPECIES: hypothetical protein [Pseudomonas]MBD8088393.1 hypothetical protein [Pseudomonas fluorescens]MBD8615161.1 hypothetical protein [Pseudomonas putida]MBD8681164.1 hypothetical protein [Pseudomonas sp. CFBP 13719]
MSAPDPSVQSNAGSVLADGVASAVNDKLVNADSLQPNTTSDALKSGSERNLGLEDSQRKADDLLKGHEKGMTPEERDLKAKDLMASLARTNPMPNQAPRVAEEAAETMRRLVKAIMNAIKSIFKLGADAENDGKGGESEPIWMLGRGQHASGFGVIHDQLKELMEKKTEQFDDASKDAAKTQESDLDKAGLDTPEIGQKK